jgi:hypothetical protein
VTNLGPDGEREGGRRSNLGRPIKSKKSCIERECKAVSKVEINTAVNRFNNEFGINWTVGKCILPRS